MNSEAGDAEELLVQVLGREGYDGQLAFDAPPELLGGGRSASLFRFRLSAGPGHLVDRELVLRVLPDDADSVAECVIQAALGRAGFPTPEVLVIDATPARPCVVMAHCPGSLMPRALGLRALRLIPVRLAALMDALHRIDPEPVRTALDESGIESADLVERAMASITAACDATGDPGLAAVADWLHEQRPPRGPDVVCHGDLHALNVLVVDGSDVLLDWEMAGFAGPAFDVARSNVMFRALPLTIPRPVRPIIERLGGRAAARFETAYRDRRRLAPEEVAWHEVLHSARLAGLVLADHVAPTAAPGVVAAWQEALPSLGREIRRLTGITVTRAEAS